MLDISRSLKKDTAYKNFYMQEVTLYEYAQYYYSVDWQSRQFKDARFLMLLISYLNA